MPCVRAVLFDATGTLIELTEPVSETYTRFARAQGVALQSCRVEAAWRSVIESSGPRVFPGADAREIESLERDWWQHVVEETFRSADPDVWFPDFERLFAALFGHFATRHAWRLRIGALPMLRTLREREVRLGIVSNFDYRLNQLLQSLEIALFFDSVTLPGPLRVEKPDALLFRRALADLGVEPIEAVYVGNDPAIDLAGARAAGLRALDVTCLHSLAELPDRLATLGSRS